MIDFEMTTQQAQVKEFVHQFSKNVVRPISLQADRDHRIPDAFLELQFFTAVSFIGRARDITVQDLKVECFFPADAATDQFARRLAATPETVAV